MKERCQAAVGRKKDAERKCQLKVGGVGGRSENSRENLKASFS